MNSYCSKLSLFAYCTTAIWSFVKKDLYLVISLKLIGLLFERPYLMEGQKLMIAKSAKSAVFADFDVVFADFAADFDADFVDFDEDFVDFDVDFARFHRFWLKTSKTDNQILA